MRGMNVSLAFSTYQASKLFLVGSKPDDGGSFSIYERTFGRCMGLHVSPERIWLSSIYQVWRLENALATGETQDGFDACYVPQVGYITGDLDIHDLHIGKDGRPVFVNTLFGCVATVSESHSFVPLWRPPWLSKLAAEDRCHLNGLAMQDQQPAFVTAVSRSDVRAGWREHRRDGGVVCDVRSNEVVAEGLSMPHSPRWYRDQLWLLEAGSGHFGRVDLTSGKFERIAFCPGFLRGLTFVGDYAVVGMSKNRKNRTFADLELSEHLEKHGVEPRCGLQVIHLKTGDVVESMTLEGVVEELFDVGIIPGVLKPMMIGVLSDDIKRFVSVG